MLGAPTIVTAAGVSVTVSPPSNVPRPNGNVTIERFTLIAERDLGGMRGDRFESPRVGVRWHRSAFDSGIEFLGFAFTQFALPVTAGAGLDADFSPHPGVSSPAAVLPLVARSGGAVVLLGPIDHVHEQVIGVDGDGLVWGWHGDLDEVPEGFTTHLGLYRADSVEAALATWSTDIARCRARQGRNPLSTQLSYWTDNGAAYWYRTESGRTISESVASVVRSLRNAQIPVGAVELDSWFYDHETPRPIADIGYPDVVPPSGAMVWTPRVDAFHPIDASHPEADDPINELRDALDGAPLVLHARHISPTSPYVTDGVQNGEEWWVGKYAAHPADPDFFRRWFDDAKRWGAVCIEQDWMQVIWFACRGMRRVPGRAEHWLRTLNRLATDSDVDLLFCMATPADMIVAADLDRVIAVRTSDDYRFADDPAILWTWFLTVNRLSNALGLDAFKDCFFSNADVGPDGDAIDGDRHAEIEAALAALSGGPVGIGDRIGRTDRSIVMRTCDDDGALRSVDRAIALTDDGLFGAPARGESLAWATTTATLHSGAKVLYVLAINTGAEPATITDVFELDSERSVYDWRAQTFHRGERLSCTLAPRDWAYFVVGPSDRNEQDWLGDPSRYVTNPTGSAAPRRR